MEVACRGKVDLDTVLKCCYGLNKVEVAIFNYLRDNGSLSTKELALLLKKDESVICRALQSLIACGLVRRDRVKKGVGRPFYTYRALDSEELKERLLEFIERWYISIRKAIIDL